MKSKYTFGSMFAGIGGIDLGFERCGMECRWQVEIDPYATKVLEKHWPSVNRWGDVKTFPPDDNEKWKVDVIAGGFPCQDISTAGKGEGLDGERSGLFYEIIRVARQVRPRAIVLENVAALLARGMGDVLGELAEIGFDAEWHCIPAAAVGAPHRRDRVFIIAYTKHDGSHGNGKDEQKCEREEMGRSQFARGDGGDWNVADSNGPLSKRGWISGGIQQKHSNINGYSFRRRKEILAYANSERQSGQRLHGGRISKEENQKRKADRSICGSKRKENHWYIEPDVGRVADGVPRRMDRLKCLGNAVVPQVAEVVGKILLERLKENEKASP